MPSPPAPSPFSLPVPPRKSRIELGFFLQRFRPAAVVIELAFVVSGPPRTNQRALLAPSRPLLPPHRRNRAGRPYADVCILIFDNLGRRPPGSNSCDSGHPEASRRRHQLRLAELRLPVRGIEPGCLVPDEFFLDITNLGRHCPGRFRRLRTLPADADPPLIHR